MQRAMRNAWVQAGLVSVLVGCSSSAASGPGEDPPQEPSVTPDHPKPPVEATSDAGKVSAPTQDAGTPSVTREDAGLPAVDAQVEAAAVAVDAGTEAASGPNVGASIASIALANVGKGACSTNSAGGTAFETSCTGNGGLPEYWCADFVQWVWQEAGVDTYGLDAAAGSFYTYGQNFGTLHTTPSLGDAVVFNYQGGGYAEHVAIVVQVNADGSIETTSGDWNGDGATEAAFSSTSLVVLNTPAYLAPVNSTPAVMAMAVAGFISPAPSGSMPLAAASVAGASCYSDTLMKQMDDNACVQSSSDSDWYQCDDGEWVVRDSDPWTCNGQYPL